MTLPETNLQTYHIYGRKSYPEPLSYVDQVQIANESDLSDKVFEYVEETDWVELVAFPAKAAIQVIPGEADL